MFVESVKLKTLLYEPEHDNSEILDIFTEKSVNYIDTFDANQDPAIRADVVSTEYIKYRFYFRVDMSEALRRNINSVTFSLRKDLQSTESSVFQGAGNSEEMIKAIYSYEQDNKENVRADDVAGLLYRQQVDIMSVMNNETANKRISDAAKFGIVQKVKIVDPNKWRSLGKKLPFAQHPSDTIDKRITGMTQSEAYVRCLSLGVDPGNIYEGSSGFSPADPKKKGTYISKKKRTGDFYFDSLKNSMMENVIPPAAQPEIYRSRTAEIGNDNNLIAIVEDKIDKIMLVPVDIRVPRSIFIGTPEVIVTLDCPDRHGLIVDRLNIRINHSKNIQDYFTPKKPLIISAASSFMSPDNNITVTVKRQDTNVKSCRIYYRILKESDAMANSQFQLLDMLDFRGTQTASSVFNIGNFSESVVIFRVVPISNQGVSYGNFSSTVFKRGVFVPYLGTVDTRLKSGGVKVLFSNGSSNVIGVKFLKRDLTANERNFTPIVNVVPDPNSDEINPAVFGSSGKKVELGDKAEIVDTRVRHGHSYEYKAMLYLKNGVQKMSRGTKIQKYVDPVSIVGLSAQAVGSTPSSKTFNVDFSIPSTETELIISALVAAGLGDLYTSDISALKSSLHDAILIGCSRLDMVSGETDHIGFFAPGAIIDNGSVGKPPSNDRKYTYKFEAYVISPQVAITDLLYENQDPAVQTFNSLQDLRSPRNMQAIREKAIQQLNLDVSVDSSSSKYVADKTVKAFSTAGLTKGTVVSPESSFDSKIVIKSSPEKFSTGICKYVQTGPADGTSIRSSSVSLGRNGNVVSWSLTAQSAKNVDFFVILAKKQGRTNIAGTSISTNAGGSHRFVDYENKDFVGMITYFVVPVFLTGEKGPEFDVGSAVMLDRSKKFRRKG